VKDHGNFCTSAVCALEGCSISVSAAIGPDKSFARDKSAVPMKKANKSLVYRLSAHRRAHDVVGTGRAQDLDFFQCAAGGYNDYWKGWIATIGIAPQGVREAGRRIRFGLVGAEDQLKSLLAKHANGFLRAGGPDKGGSS